MKCGKRDDVGIVPYEIRLHIIFYILKSERKHEL